jgi:hypothetical protein
MKRFLFFAVLALPMAGTGPFDQRLSQDRQILQALNRLTFGSRPGDVEEVRRLGVVKWIDLQLHPERIPEDPDLDARLKPLETLRMDLPDIVKKYTPQQEPLMMLGMAMRDNPLPQEQKFCCAFPHRIWTTFPNTRRKRTTPARCSRKRCRRKTAGATLPCRNFSIPAS